MRNSKVKQKHIFYEASSSPLPSYMRKVPNISQGPTFCPINLINILKTVSNILTSF